MARCALPTCSTYLPASATSRRRFCCASHRTLASNARRLDEAARRGYEQARRDLGFGTSRAATCPLTT